MEGDTMFALRELLQVLADALSEAWAAADLGRRLGAWWWVVTHQDLVDAPAPIAVTGLNDRQLTALELVKEQGRVTNGDLQEQYYYHPETLRQDLASLVELGYLEKRGRSRGTFYTPGRLGAAGERWE
jgi:hypothetical protein